MSAPTSAAAARREAVAGELLLALLLFGIPLALASIPRVFRDGDTSWHVAVGQWIAANGRIPGADPFSHTAAGQPWVAMEWLAELVQAGAHALAGPAGLAALVAAALMAVNGIVYAHIRRSVGPVGLALAIVGMDVVLSAFTVARPHVLVWPVLAWWTALLAKSSETARPPPLWSALLLTLWANLHGSFPLAAAIGGCLALDALLAARWTTLRQWLLFAAVCLAAICLNANGPAGIVQPFHIATLESLNLVAEWLPATPATSPQFYGMVALVLAILLWRGASVPPGRLLLLLLLLGMAFTQVRHQSWLAIVAAILLPPLFAGTPQPERRLAPLVVAAAALALGRALWPLTPPESESNPRGLIAAVPADLRTEPLFNDYTFGGPLILAGIRPYIDGRNDVYGDAFNRDYVEIAGGDFARFQRAVERHGIRWTMLSAGNAKLIGELDRSGEWRRVYADQVGVIHARREAPAASAARPGTGAASRPAAGPGPPPA